MEAIIDRQEQLSENEILAQIISGNKRLYEQIIRKYNPRLFRIGMSIVNDSMDVEELMQIAFIKAYENLPRFESRSSFSTWLTRIFMNECYQHLKKKNQKRKALTRGINLKDFNSTDMKVPDRLLLNKELGKALEQALVHLPEKYRTVFVMREMEDMSIADTMDALSISESNVKVRLNRAKTMLKDNLSAFYKNDVVYNFHLSRCDRVANNILAAIGAM
jgi:RNA polymerase sigma-70 factor (ECF subfamily)